VHRAHGTFAANLRSTICQSVNVQFSPPAKLETQIVDEIRQVSDARTHKAA